MKNICFALLLALLASLPVSAQDNLIRHKVQAGETVTQIAQKYKVTPADIFRLNPDARTGLKPETVILIQPSGGVKPSATKPSAATDKPWAKTHEVQAQETLYGIARMYNISTADLLKANPGIEPELKLGQVLKLPAEAIKTGGFKPSKQTAMKKEIYHQVEAKETKYSIARQYNTTVAQLEADNPEIATGLQIGYRLKITPGPTQGPMIINTDAGEPTKPKASEPTHLEYTVKAKETMYSLGRKFNMSSEQLMALNPDLKQGVREGMMIRYPSGTVLDELAGPVEKGRANLLQTLNTSQRKKLAILLPFNISKIEGDTVNSTAARLKTDKFLNMTLDFYSGVQMAIDSARTLNLNIDVKILDSQETKNSSAVASLIREQGLNKYDALVGPFYQANAEETAKLLLSSKVPVVSPLSKEEGTRYENLMQAMPSADLIRMAMIDYLRSQKGNIVAIVDPKRASTRQFLATYYPGVKIVPLPESGLVSADVVSPLLVKGMMNYVIFDSEKTRMVLNTLNTLISLQQQYQVQLAILEKNNTLDFEEVPLKKLAQLKMLYPSLSRDNETVEGAIFEKKYKEINKVFPNVYATRGFDVTFDTMLRLSQEKTFMETIEGASTEYIENKFDYETQPTGAHINKGVYILHYETDLSVKEAVAP